MSYFDSTRTALRHKGMGIRSDRWPLEGIRLAALVKVVDFDTFYHKGDNPYTQISVGGFALIDPQGGYLFANVQLSTDYGYTEEVRNFKNLLRPGSIHWVECENYIFGDSEIQMYLPVFRLVAPEDYDGINRFFPVAVDESRAPGEGEFYYAGAVYAENEGKFIGVRR